MIHCSWIASAAQNHAIGFQSHDYLAEEEPKFEFRARRASHRVKHTLSHH